MKLILKALKYKRRVLVCRRYGTTIKDTVFAQFISSLTALKILQYCKVSEYNRTITLPNGSEFIFKALDEETKLLSLTDISDIFIEEIWEVPKEIFEQLNTRLRANVPFLELYFCFNPISVNHWLYEWVHNPPANSFILKTTYRDNKFLNPAVVESYIEQGKRNAKWKEVYLDGNFGSDPEGLVFGKNTRFEKLDVNALLKDRSLEVRVGSDSGVIDASTIVVSLYDKRTQTIYVINEWYLRGATLDDHYNAIVNLGLLKTKIVVDSADTRLINYLKSKRVNAVPTIKGKGSVEARIDYLLNSTIIIDEERCPNTAMEFQNFSWIKDKQTSKYTEKTTHEWSHTVDALSYAYNDLYTAKKVTFINKSSLGL